MRIARIATVGVRVNHRGDWIFVHVETDEGLTGLGEASHSGNDHLLREHVRELERTLVGLDPTNISHLRTLLRGNRAGRIGGTAWSAIEQACQDLRGQVMGVPLHQVLGGKVRDRVRLYANINRHVEARTPQGFARAAAQAVKEGFTALKLAPFDEVKASERRRSGAAADWRMGVERVAAVRDAVGPAVEIAVDCHSRFSVKEALAVAEALEPLNLFWFEEPVPVRDIAGLAAIAKRIRQPLATAESLFGAEAFEAVMAGGAADVVMPDVKHAGGLQETLVVGEWATVRGIGFAPHNPSGPVATVASGQVAACVPGFTLLEYAWGEVEWRADLLDPPERIEDGCLILNDAPGLGHRLNSDVVSEHRAASLSRTDSSKAQV